MNELRKDPLLNRWVAVMKDSKPLDYYLSTVSNKGKAKRENSCALCAGREKETPQAIFTLGNGETPLGQIGWKTRVIPWLNYVFQIEGDLGRRAVGMYDRMNSVGANEIIIESPKHNEYPEDMGLQQMRYVLKTYRHRLVDLEKDHRLRYTFICKDTSVASQGTEAHAHSKVLCPPVIPKGIKDELDGAKEFFYYKERCIFCDMLSEELNVGRRIVMESKDFVAFVPYAPKTPFECWIVPKRHECVYQNISDYEIEDLAMTLGTVLRKIRKAFVNAPYYYVIHSAPNRIPRKDYWHTIGEDYHWHIEIVPKIKEPTGFEIESDFYVLHTSPEDAAKIIQEVR